MNDQFKAFESDLQHLKPEVKERALAIAEQLIEKGYETQEALKEGLRRAENWFLDAEG